MFCACLAALLNPYGFGLYRHVGHLLVVERRDRLIDEYQPIPFGKPNARAIEWILLALVAVPTVSTARMTRYDLIQSLVWLHLASPRCGTPRCSLWRPRPDSPG